MSGGTDGRRPKSPKSVRRRRGWSLIIILAVLAVCASVAAIAQTLANKERVDAMWVGAEIRADGSARITEVIDYDFGHSGDSHGIYRDVPDADFDDEQVRATMDGHKVPFESMIGDSYRDVNGRQSYAERLRVGDPRHTVSGVHRYRVQYTLPEVVKGGKLAWDAVGTGWKVDRAHVEVHVVDDHAFTGLRCAHGTWDAGKPCAVRQSEPGHLVVRLDRLQGHEGLTLYATAAKAKTAAPAALPSPPDGAALGTTLPHPMRNGGLCLAVAVACAALTVCGLRFAGRDSVRGDARRERRVEIERLARSVTPSPTPPDDLTPVQGGLLRLERVADEHKVAWLLTAAADGHISIAGNEQRPILHRRDESEDRRADRETRDVLDKMFGGRDSLVLGTRDHWFRESWSDLEWKLQNWINTSDLWDGAAARRGEKSGMAGLGGALLGLVLAITGGILNGRRLGAGPPLLLAGAVAAGIGAALLVRGWELGRRTPRGTESWLRVEAFRRYLLDPAACSGEPLDEERLQRYTAWAVALGVQAAWEEAAAASSSSAPRPPLRSSPDLGDVLLAATVLSSASSPSSSGGSSSGGGGGSSSGGVGGGAGGGGGGSW